MERKIGEIFEYNGEWYQCIADTTDDSCNNCFFQKSCSDITGDCSSTVRSDGESVAFKKLEKVGEPYEHHGKLNKCYKLPMETEIRLLPNNCNPIGKDNLVEIAIKQIKEDMEEKKIQHYDCFFDGKPTLKEFNLEAAKSGKPVCTRDGRKARIICFDAKGDKPIIALVEAKGNKDALIEKVERYFINGHSVFEIRGTNNDLMMLPEKREGWVNVYKGGLLDTKSYNTKKEAFDKASPKDYIDTVKIEWYE